MNKNDWSSADIIASLKKQGTTLAAVSRQAGLASCTLSNALVRRWPKGERLIADALEKRPEEIWPSRYQDMAGRHADKEEVVRLPDELIEKINASVARDKTDDPDANFSAWVVDACITKLDH